MKSLPCICGCTESPLIKFDTLRFDNAPDKIVANARCRAKDCKFNVNLLFGACEMPLVELGPTMTRHWNEKVRKAVEEAVEKQNKES